MVQEAMEVSMPMFAVGFRCKSEENGLRRMKQEIVADLACEMLAGESSALYQRLYEENIIDSDFSVGFEGAKGIGFVAFSGDSNAPEKVRDALLAESRRMLEEGLNEKDFLRLKKSAMGRRIRDLDSFESICYRMCASYFEYEGMDYFEFPSLYEAVSLKDIDAFLRDTICEERMVLSLIEPKE